MVSCWSCMEDPGKYQVTQTVRGQRKLHGIGTGQPCNEKRGRSPFPVPRSDQASASMRRVMIHCWAMDNTLLVSQYSVKPAGNQSMNTVKIAGIHFITWAWVGSAGVGLRRIWINMLAPISNGSTKYGSITDRSWIQPKNGTWRSSTDSSST